MTDTTKERADFEAWAYALMTRLRRLCRQMFWLNMSTV